MESTISSKNYSGDGGMVDSNYSIIQQLLPSSLSFSQLLLLALTLFFALSVRWYYAVPKLMAPIVPSGDGILRRLTGMTSYRLGSFPLVYKGYTQFTKPLEKPFVLELPGYRQYVMPPKYLADVRGATWDKLHFAQTLHDMLNLGVTIGDLITYSRMDVDVVKFHLNPSLGKLTDRLVRERDYALHKELKSLLIPGKESATVSIVEVAAHLVHRVSSSTIVGTNVNRNESWLEPALKYTIGVWDLGLVFKHTPAFCRNMVAWFVGWSHRRHLRQSTTFLIPEIKNRLKQQKTDPDWESNKPMDVIQWMLDMPPTSAKEQTPERQAERAMHLTFAATGTLTVLFTHCIIDLLMHPEYLEPLREEITRQVKEHGGWNDVSLNKMRKLDSFVRECLRLQPPNVFSVHRTVIQKDFVFSDGFTLPKDSKFCFPGYCIGLDEDNFQDATKFDGFRFSRMREESGQEADWQSVKIGPTYLPFGFGNQACPGRFFGTKVVKLLFSRFLLDFDFKFATPQVYRPANYIVDGQILPDPQLRMEFRLRKGSDEKDSREVNPTEV